MCVRNYVMPRQETVGLRLPAGSATTLTIVRRPLVSALVLWAEMSPSPVSLHQNFGRVLRRVRIEVGMSQERLALECDLDRTFISLLERGLRQPTLTTLVVLAQALDLEPAELVRQTMA